MDLLLLAPLFERANLELSTIFTNQDSRGTESREDILSHELYHLPTYGRS